MGCFGLTAHLGLRGNQAECVFSFFRNGVNNDAERWISPQLVEFSESCRGSRLIVRGDTESQFFVMSEPVGSKQTSLSYISWRQKYITWRQYQCQPHVVLQHHVGLSPTSGTCLVEMWHIIVTKHHLKHHTTCFKWDVNCTNLLPKLVRLREVKVSVNGHDWLVKL